MNFLRWLFAIGAFAPRELSPAERDDAQAKILLEAQARELERRLEDRSHDRRFYRRRKGDRSAVP